MDEAQIGLVEKSDAVQARMTLHAPISGIVTELAAREGSTVIPGMTLARINGLGTVWAHAEVPESQAAQLRIGAPVKARSPALPGTVFEGRVQALLPEVNAGTRTLKARMDLRNPGGRLVPGMFVQMALSDHNVEKTLLVPTEALIRTGIRTVVMVAEKDGAFRPVEVEAGIEADGMTEIRSGLEVGQKVVLSGQFLIDSEASLKGIEARLGPSNIHCDGRHSPHQRSRRSRGRRCTDADPPAIPSLKWPAMTMDFKLAPNLQKPVPGVGRNIEIEFRMQEGDAPLIVAIRRAADKGGAR